MANTTNPESFETKSLIFEAMTEQEHRAYDYFYAEQEEGKKKGGCLHKKDNNDMTAEEYDRMVMDKLNEYASKSKALERIGMDESQVQEIEPIRFYGFEKKSNRITDVYASKICEDGRWRSTVCSVTWLFFSNDQLCLYSGKFDLLSSAKTELTDEYFYKDITNFTTVTETEQSVVINSQMKGCLKKTPVTESSKKLTDYDTFSLIVPGDKFSCSVSGVANAKQIIDGLKQKLREKKVF